MSAGGQGGAPELVPRLLVERAQPLVQRARDEHEPPRRDHRAAEVHGAPRLRAGDGFEPGKGAEGSLPPHVRDRKSTRLNSSHLVISYAVFCLKKKKKFPRSMFFLQLKAKLEPPPVPVRGPLCSPRLPLASAAASTPRSPRGAARCPAVIITTQSISAACLLARHDETQDTSRRLNMLTIITMAPETWSSTIHNKAFKTFTYATNTTPTIAFFFFLNNPPPPEISPLPLPDALPISGPARAPRARRGRRAGDGPTGRPGRSGWGRVAAPRRCRRRSRRPRPGHPVVARVPPGPAGQIGRAHV